VAEKIHGDCATAQMLWYLSLEHEMVVCISLQTNKISVKLTQIDLFFEKTCKSHCSKTYFELV